MKFDRYDIAFKSIVFVSAAFVIALLWRACFDSKEEWAVYRKLAAARTDLPDTLTEDERAFVVYKEFKAREPKSKYVHVYNHNWK